MGKSTLSKRIVDVIKQEKVDTKKTYGILRQNFSGVSSGNSLTGGTGGSGVENLDGSKYYLKTGGLISGFIVFLIPIFKCFYGIIGQQATELNIPLIKR